KETKPRISNHADTFERHQRAHNVSEIRRQAERIFVNHFREIVSQLFEVHFSKLEIEIVREETLHHRTHRLRINTRLEEIQVDDVLAQSLHVARDHVEEGIDHLRLKLRTDPSHHSEIEERKMPAVHNKKIARMWIGVKETV